ncbi:MAG: N-acetylmuramidase family protein [Rhizobiaceae bacterium]
MFTPQSIREISLLAEELAIPPAALQAIAEVESGGRIYADIGSRQEPLIRFEGHYFDRLLNGAQRQTARQRGLAHPKAGRIGNPRNQAKRWALLNRAIRINRIAALSSTSWGLGQVMGAHWQWLGYGSVDALVAQARAGAAGQVRLMARYIDKAGLVPAIQNRDWKAFARGYNGPAYARHAYDQRLKSAYQRLSTMDGKQLEITCQRGEFAPTVKGLEPQGDRDKEPAGKTKTRLGAAIRAGLLFISKRIL